jgi:hypothetical protein
MKTQRSERSIEAGRLVVSVHRIGASLLREFVAKISRRVAAGDMRHGSDEAEIARSQDTPCRAIEDFALIGDCRTVALNLRASVDGDHVRLAYGAVC